jgi:hypothetical protein
MAVSLMQWVTIMQGVCPISLTLRLLFWLWQAKLMYMDTTCAMGCEYSSLIDQKQFTTRPVGFLAAPTSSSHIVHSDDPLEIPDSDML